MMNNMLALITGQRARLMAKLPLNQNEPVMKSKPFCLGILAMVYMFSTAAGWLMCMFQQVQKTLASYPVPISILTSVGVQGYKRPIANQVHS